MSTKLLPINPADISAKYEGLNLCLRFDLPTWPAVIEARVPVKKQASETFSPFGVNGSLFAGGDEYLYILQELARQPFDDGKDEPCVILFADRSGKVVEQWYGHGFLSHRDMLNSHHIPAFRLTRRENSALKIDKQFLGNRAKATFSDGRVFELETTSRPTRAWLQMRDANISGITGVCWEVNGRYIVHDYDSKGRLCGSQNYTDLYDAAYHLQNSFVKDLDAPPPINWDAVYKAQTDRHEYAQRVTKRLGGTGFDIGQNGVRHYDNGIAIWPNGTVQYPAHIKPFTFNE